MTHKQGDEWQLLLTLTEQERRTLRGEYAIFVLSMVIPSLACMTLLVLAALLRDLLSGV